MQSPGSPGWAFICHLSLRILAVVGAARFHHHHMVKTIETKAAVTAATSAARSAPLVNRFRPYIVITTSAATDMTTMANALPVAVPMRRAQTAIAPNRSSLRDSFDMWNSLYCVLAQRSVSAARGTRIRLNAVVIIIFN